jgi:biotin-dependent carboxylase-like uncharacterized protein
MNLLHILKPGVRTTCQDTGRFGFESIGIGHSGAADQLSYHLLNWLLGNPRNAPVLEIILGGFEARILAPSTLAIGGAKMHATLNGQPLSNWSRFRVEKGDILTLSHATEGQIAYLGTPGGFACERLFGSVSVNVREAIGHVLKRDDTIATSRIASPMLPATLHPDLIPDLKVDTLTLHYTPGYQAEWFDRVAFEASTFAVTTQHDKMGCRLTGTPILSTQTALISEGIAYGAIQITHDGDPIVLLSDRQTIGGYPKIGSILPIDGWRLVQCRTGCRITFEAIDTHTALKLMQPTSTEAIAWFPF